MLGFEHVSMSMHGKNHSLQFKDNNLVETKDTIVSKIENDDFDMTFALLIKGKIPPVAVFVGALTLTITFRLAPVLSCW